MKKIMVAAIAVAVAAVAQAATFNWSNTGSKTTGTVYDFAGNKLAAGTAAYLFCVSDISQADLLTAVRDDASSFTSKAIAGANTTLNSSSKVSLTEDFSYGTAGNNYTFYFAILDAANDQLLISSTMSADAVDVGSSPIAFTGSATWSKTANGDAAYGSAGWYSTTSVPEPTSGLLLLLGMAGLALRRKQA